MVQLESLANIRMGTTLRGRDATRSVATGSCQLVRIGDVSQDGTWLNEAFVRIEPSENIRDDQFLQDGDVLFPNRGNRTTAIAYRLGVSRVLAGAQFFVLRPDQAKVLPEYLAWYLRAEESVRYFDEHRKGTYVPIIQRPALAEMKIPLPLLAVQHKIVEIDALATQEHDLAVQLATSKIKLMNGQLVEAAKNAGKGKNKDTRTDKDNL